MYDISSLSTSFFAPEYVGTYEPVPRPLRKHPTTLIEAFEAMSVNERAELLSECGAATEHSSCAWDTMLELIDPSMDHCEGFFYIGKNRVRVCFTGGCVDVYDRTE